ncbi:MAG: hypothetical protein M3350_04015 [Actinomycetota bacterium]|nr:hypothetical protein [Actinomycetota bacterium]
MTESHLAEVERTLLYVSEARQRAAKALTVLEAGGADASVVRALQDCEQSLADEHRSLMQRTFYAVPDDQEKLGV